MRLTAAASIGALLLAAPLVCAQAAEVKVLSAIGMRQVMLDLGPKFERATGHTLAITFDSTGLIAKRVAAGEQVDVVLMNRSAIDPLVNEGKLLAGSMTPIAASVAAVAVRQGSLKPTSHRRRLSRTCCCRQRPSRALPRTSAARAAITSSG